MLVKSYYGPGTSLFYPMAAPAAAAGMPITANPFGTAVTANGAMPNTITSAAAMTGGASLHAHNLAAAAAAAAAAQQQQQQNHAASVLTAPQFHLAAASSGQAAVKTTVSPVTSQQQSSIINSGHNTAAVSNIPTNSAKLGSPSAKKFRPAYTRPSHKGARYIPKPIPQELGNLKTYSSPDILICGNCREMFNDLVDMMEHKRDYCKLRFTCKCDTLNEDGECLDANCATNTITSQGSSISTSASAVTAASTTSTTSTSSGNKPPRPKWLHCNNCKSPFANAWDLMVHVQTAHMMNIYQLADTTKLQNIQQQQPRQRASVSPSSSSALSTSPLASPNAQTLCNAGDQSNLPIRTMTTTST